MLELFWDPLQIEIEHNKVNVLLLMLIPNSQFFSLQGTYREELYTLLV